MKVGNGNKPGFVRKHPTFAPNRCEKPCRWRSINDFTFICHGFFLDARSVTSALQQGLASSAAFGVSLGCAAFKLTRQASMTFNASICRKVFWSKICQLHLVQISLCLPCWSSSSILPPYLSAESAACIMSCRRLRSPAMQHLRKSQPVSFKEVAVAPQNVH